MRSLDIGRHPVENLLVHLVKCQCFLLQSRVVLQALLVFGKALAQLFQQLPRPGRRPRLSLPFLVFLQPALILLLQNRGFRVLEAFVIALVATVAVCFGVELLLARPDFAAVAGGLVPTTRIVTDPAMLYIAIGILGATVMPHNLYLHSAIVQTRKIGDTPAEKRRGIKYATVDSTVALLFAFFINAAILILAAATFHQSGHQDVAEISDAHRLLTPLLGTAAASTLFALALLASGQNSSVTGTLAGQIVMEGFLDIRLPPWLRRLITRLIAIVPAVIVTALYGVKGTGALLILSQVILSLQLSFAVVPLVLFTGQKSKMGQFANGRLLSATAWVTAVVIALLNVWLLTLTARVWLV